MVERCLGYRTWMAGLALAICGLLAPAPAAADWSTNTCKSCHGGTPPNVANTVVDATSPCTVKDTTFGLGESFMNSQALFQAHVNSQGTACSVGVMTSLTGTETTDIYNYLVNVRDGFIGSFAPTFADTAVGSSRDAAVSFTVANYRKVAMAYSVSASGDYSIVSHTATRHRLLGGKCPRGGRQHQPLDVHGRPDDPLHAVRRRRASPAR